MQLEQANGIAVNSFQQYSDSYGYLKSIVDERPVNGQGGIMPMYTYPAFYYLQRLDFSGLRVFAYLGGYSSIWWAFQAKNVINIEINPQAHWLVGTQKLDNLSSATICEHDKISYNQAFIAAEDGVDIITLDRGDNNVGVADAIKEALEQNKINPAIIVLNDTVGQKACWEILNSLKDFISVDFQGLRPCSGGSWCTSVFISKQHEIPHKS